MPRGRELIFAKGLLHGFHDDLASAVSVLIPQVENGLGSLLLVAGEHPYAQDTDGIQDYSDLNRVIDHPTLLEVLGPHQVFDLRGLLVARSGANLRNNVAHGLVGIEGRAGTSPSICGGEHWPSPLASTMSLAQTTSPGEATFQATPLQSPEAQWRSELFAGRYGGPQSLRTCPRH